MGHTCIEMMYLMEYQLLEGYFLAVDTHPILCIFYCENTVSFAEL